MNPENTLVLPEAAARRLLLVQAIDSADTQGKLLSPVERDQLEQRALDEGRTAGAPLDPARYLQARASHWLAAVENRNPRIAALQHLPVWQRWLAWGLPLVALVLGAALDRIDNPHQVNLLSPPLLAFLFWNLLVYAVLLVAPLVQRRVKTPTAPHWWAALASRRTPGLRARVSAQFQWLWLRPAGAMEGHRWKCLLHTSALAWALGVALSIAIGGLVREYRVGWESTLLELPQVHAFLRLLFAPVTALLPIEPFTMAELARLHFRSGAEVGPEQARRWVGLYIGLLLLVVAVPRALLALHAAWRRWQLGRALRIDVSDPYFREVLGRVSPARVLLCLLPGASPARAAWLQALQQAAPQRPQGPQWQLAATARGDELRVVDLPVGSLAPAAAAGSTSGLLAKWLPRRQVVSAPQDGFEHARSADVLLAAEPGAAQGELAQALARPVLLAGPPACWYQDGAWLQAIAQRLPSFKAPGMARLSQAWEERNQARLAQAMRLVAAGLVRAARDAEEVRAAPINLRRLIDPAERDAGEHARRAAMDAVLHRLDQARLQSYRQLLELHALSQEASLAAAAPLEHGFRIHEAVDSPQAGMAGAASGAALGATVDLMVGGLTLGAATALGALVGGGAAYVAAAWKNRTAASGASMVQLGDDMLQALVESDLLQYLAVIHQGRLAGELPEGVWRHEVAAAVAQARAPLQTLWGDARGAGDSAAAEAALGRELQTLALRVLRTLYGTPPATPT